MLLGEHRHTLDAKNRTFLPAKLRDDLGENVVLCCGVDKCLTLYSAANFEKFMKRLSELPQMQTRAVQRWLSASAESMTVDSQGRIMIPTRFKEFAGLDKNLISVGVMNDHVEIWSESAYETVINQISPEEVAAALIDLGM